MLRARREGVELLLDALADIQQRALVLFLLLERGEDLLEQGRASIPAFDETLRHALYIFGTEVLLRPHRPGEQSHSKHHDQQRDHGPSARGLVQWGHDVLLDYGAGWASLTVGASAGFAS